MFLRCKEGRSPLISRCKPILTASVVTPISFDTALFSEENLGQIGNAKCRIFYGPGIENFNMTLQQDLRLSEVRSLAFALRHSTSSITRNFMARSRRWTETSSFIQFVSIRLAQKKPGAALVLRLSSSNYLRSSGSGNSIEYRFPVPTRISIRGEPSGVMPLKK